MSENQKLYWVSVTGLQVKKPWKYILFFWYAIPAFRQSKKAKGILFSEVRRVNGVEHTLTIWENKNRMLEYRNSGAHLRAIKHFRKIATGRTYGFESKIQPSWDEALSLWQHHAKEY